MPAGHATALAIRWASPDGTDDLARERQDLDSENLISGRIGKVKDFQIVRAGVDAVGIPA